MTTTARGKIKNRSYATTINDYSGVRYGKITPTDIDGFIDFGNRAFIIIEMKYKNKPMSVGQKLAIERLTDALHSTGKPSTAFVVEHNGGLEVDAARCQVTLIRYGQKWYMGDSSTLKKMIDRFLHKHLPQYVTPNKPVSN